VVEEDGVVEGVAEGTLKANGPAVPGLLADDGPEGEAEDGDREEGSRWERWQSRSVMIDESRWEWGCWRDALGGCWG
jgi:hypothetical protein